MIDDPTEQLLARTWQPTLSVTGADGFPPIEPRRQRAAAVHVAAPAASASHRRATTPPRSPRSSAALTADPPYGATVRLSRRPAGAGLERAAVRPVAASRRSTTRRRRRSASPPRAFGEGGTIPFMGMLGELFPDAQFVVTGVLGPGSNAHGPNEFLHLPTARRVTAVHRPPARRPRRRHLRA